MNGLNLVIYVYPARGNPLVELAIIINIIKNVNNVNNGTPRRSKPVYPMQPSGCIGYTERKIWVPTDCPV